jgi:hemolysin activation/secretion protein
VVPASSASHTRTTLDLGSLQRLGTRMSASLRLSGQLASKDIDESGFFGIGGPTSIRAFPIGEVSGPTGWYGQAELRYGFEELGLTPYVFFDAGKINNTKESNRLRDRVLSGPGLGLKINRFGLDVDMVAAWEGKGGPSVEDQQNDSNSPRFWISVSKRF